MNKITRAFLSGASLAALSVAAPMAARAAVITSSLLAHAAVTVSHAQKHDFILVEHVGIVNGAFSASTGDPLINHNALTAVPFAMLTITNQSTIFISAIATASNPGGLAIASASATGFIQATTSAGSAIDKFSNTNPADFFVHANAAAFGATAAAHAHLINGVSQFASAGNTAFASMHNSGLADFEASAHATATVANADANAKASGVHQEAKATNPTGHATAEFVNTGSFVVKAQAAAHGANTAIAIATATGVNQEATNPAGLGHAKAEFINTGSFQVHAQATAAGGANNNTANACANGVMQNLPSGGTASASNAGVFQVSATAVAANAGGCAKGLVQSGPNLVFNDINKASFSINAHLNDASASATGIAIIAGSGGKVSGTIENDATMKVTAVVVGGPAIAKGIEVLADQFSGTIVNKGTLHVFAQGTTASASAIVISNEGNPSGIGTGKIVNDGGTISAGISTGAATLRGTAINVSGAPNAVDIDLEGAGSVYGNVILSPDNNDTINVINGVTFFNGGINPGGGRFGTLNVGGGAAPGTLNLVDDAIEGQSYANADTYHQFADGTLVVNIGANTIPGFVFIHANNALLGGTLVLNLAPGLYANTIPFTVVLSANPLSGNWADIATANNSMFLRPVQGGQASDIELQRIPFDDTSATPSLITHPNEFAVASGIEHSYSTGLTGPYKSLVTALLFLPTDEVQYQHILDELSGEEAGEVAWANVLSSEVLKDAVAAHLQATMGGDTKMSQLPSSIAPAAGSAMGKGAVWGGAYGKWNKADTLSAGPGNTYEAPGFDSSEEGFVVGGDMPVDPNTTVGIGGAWTGHGGLNVNNGNSGRYNGFELGAYARYNDPQNMFYLQGLASYGWYSDETTRHVDAIGLFGPGTIRGSFDSHVWQLYGEGGVHVDTGSSIDLVPYAALDYLSGDSSSYNETGLPGANLHVANAKATSFSSYLGAKVSFLNMDMAGGTLVPTLKLAWQHEFEDNIWEVNASFIGGPNSNFTVTGKGLSKDSLVAGAEVAMSFSDNVDAVLNWDGRFASNHTSNTVIGRLNFKF